MLVGTLVVNSRCCDASIKQHSRGIVVLQKCANPVCDAQFRYLDQGQLFEVEIQYSQSPRPNDPREPSNGNVHVERVRHVTGDVLLFSSGHFIRVFTARWLGLGPGAGGRYFLLSPASLSAVSYEHNLSRPVIRLWNDDHHVGT